jgi:hypothetical protein
MEYDSGMTQRKRMVDSRERLWLGLVRSRVTMPGLRFEEVFAMPAAVTWSSADLNRLREWIAGIADTTKKKARLSGLQTIFLEENSGDRCIMLHCESAV